MCYPHWMKLPTDIRQRIWDAYLPRQEVTMTPSETYVEAARAAQDWIVTHETEQRRLAVADGLEVIAKRAGLLRARVVEEWTERAAIREYVGGAKRADAETDALMDVEAVFAPPPPKQLGFKGGARYVPDGEQYW